MDGAKNKFEEAAIEAYNESLLSIQNFNTKLNFYRLNLELYNFKFFSPTYSLIQKSLQFKRGMRRERVKENSVIPVSP